MTVTGTIPMPLVELERRMTAVKLRDGSCIIYSAIALEEEAMRQIETWATPRYIIVPGDAHRLDAKLYQKRYPIARLIAPPGARKRVEKAVRVDDTEADFGDPDVTLVTMAGTGGHEAALLVRRHSGTTLIVNDMIGNLRRKDGFEGWLLHVMGFGSDEPQIPTVERLLMVDSKKRLRRQLLDWAADPSLTRILMSHGAPIDADPAGTLRELAATLQ